MRIKFSFALPVALALGASTAPAAFAIDAIPQESGLGGFVVVGAGYTDLETNFVAGNALFELGRPQVSSINAAPRSDDTVHPVITGEINYTFGDQWQAFFGTTLEDAITLDGATQLGVRKDLGDIGLLQVGYLFSGIPTQTWEDPYAEGVNRRETDRESDGVRVQWDRALGSQFQFTLTYRDISIERERSGEGVLSVACDAACQDLLRRDGDFYALDASYLFRLGAVEGSAPRHLLRPQVRYWTNDREGDAISGDGYRLQLSYVFLGQGYNVVSNVAYGGTSQDRRNPLYDRKTDSTGFAADTTLFYRLPFAGWHAVGSLLWGREDNDVRFHDNEIFSGSVGAMYRFGGR